jgi:hypothetical protein
VDSLRLEGLKCSGFYRVEHSLCGCSVCVLLCMPTEFHSYISISKLARIFFKEPYLLIQNFFSAWSTFVGMVHMRNGK